MIYWKSHDKTISSILDVSVCAAVYTESLFKSGGATKGESFLDQQFWLYFYGILISVVVHIIPNPYYGIGQYIRDVESKYIHI